MFKSSFCAVALGLCVSSMAAGITASVFSSVFHNPMGYVADPTDGSRGYVFERAGKIWEVIDGVKQASPFLDISNQLNTACEGGLLGMTLDPHFATNHQFFLNTTQGSNVDTHLLRFKTSSSTKADLNSELNIITIMQPFPNHKGGSLHFGPDGYLYMGMGDGGGQNDSLNLAQNPGVLQGKFIRIDPNGNTQGAGTHYSIPGDNPFVGRDPLGIRDEVWSVGWRNPFRWNFDSATGAMIVGDVGENAFEEINYEPTGKSGRNYGWRVREGRSTINGGGALFTPLQDPWMVVPHPDSEAIIGGVVYHGSLLPPEWSGQYFFGDYENARIWASPIHLDGNGEAMNGDGSMVDITDSLNQSLGFNISGPVSFDTNKNGEIIITDLNNGDLYQLGAVPEPASMAALGIGLVALIRKRKATRSA